MRGAPGRTPVWVEAVASEHPVPAHAVAECAGALLEAEMVGADLAWVVVTPSFAGALADIGAALTGIVAPGVVVGTVARTIMAGARVVEGGAGLAVLAVTGARCHPLRVPAGGRLGAAMIGLPAGATVALVADAATVAAEDVVSDAGDDPGLPTVVGGYPDDGGGTHPGGRFLLDDREHSDGAVGVVIAPDVEVGVATADAWSALGEALEVQAVEVVGGDTAEVGLLSGRPAAARLVEVMAAMLEEGRVVHLGLRDLRSGEVLAVGRGTSADRVRVSPAPRPGSMVEVVAVTAASARRGLLGALANGSPHGGAPGALLGFLDSRRPALVDAGTEGDAAAVADLVGRPAVVAMGCTRVLGPGLGSAPPAAAAALTFG